MHQVVIIATKVSSGFAVTARVATVAAAATLLDVGLLQEACQATTSQREESSQCLYSINLRLIDQKDSRYS